MLECMKNMAKPHNDARWIPVTERLPENYGCYLVAWRPHGIRADYIAKMTGGLPHYYEICEYDPDDGGWKEKIEQANGRYEIIAWMPLPDPYKEREE